MTFEFIGSTKQIQIVGFPSFCPSREDRLE